MSNFACGELFVSAIMSLHNNLRISSTMLFKLFVFTLQVFNNINNLWGCEFFTGAILGLNNNFTIIRGFLLAAIFNFLRLFNNIRFHLRFAVRIVFNKFVYFVHIEIFKVGLFNKIVNSFITFFDKCILIIQKFALIERIMFM